ncbi:MAG: IS1182 family transposase [Paludibaculum sp.]
MEQATELQGKIKYLPIDRAQMRLEPLDIDGLIPQNHAARVIWAVSGRFDFSAFETNLKSREQTAGRPCWSPRLLASLWIYSYSLGVASARAIERMMAYEPGMRWLAGTEVINHHTLSDFRVGNGEGVEGLFAQFLAMLETAGVVDFHTMLQDGTKVKAVAGRSSLHRRKTLQQRLKQARKVMRELDRRANEEAEGVDRRREAAQKRAAEEAVKRAAAALEKLKKLEADGTPRNRKEIRVSESEPDARKMKHADGSWAPSYNVQVSTEPKCRMIVGIGVSTEANDTQALLPAVEKVKDNTGQQPRQVIADNGYATRGNVEMSSALEIELIAPWKEDRSREAGACARNGIAEEFAPSAFRGRRGGKQLICPAGKQLVVIQERVHHGVLREKFAAQASDCGQCQFQKQCCPGGGARQVERVVESPAMKRYLSRMKQPEIKKLYKKRSEIAEYPHMWAKAVKGWRRFSVRGVMKAGMEALWVALAYNVTQWTRVRPEAEAA